MGSLPLAPPGSPMAAKEIQSRPQRYAAAFKELMSYFGRLYILYLLESVVTSKRNWELRKLISLEACDKTDRKVYSLGGVFFVWGLFCF